MKYLIILILGVILLTSCEKEYFIRYTIESEVDSLTIIYKKVDAAEIDTNLIHSGSSLQFATLSGYGMNGEEYLEENQEIPLDSLKILNSDNIPVNFDPLNSENWFFYGPDEGGETGTVELRIYDDSFEY